jgi:hypothetical protein
MTLTMWGRGISLVLPGIETKYPDRLARILGAALANLVDETITE